VGNGADALKTCAKGTTITGIDVSTYQGNVNWTQVRASGQEFAFARISDGLKVVDTKFAQNWPAIKGVGMVRGSYQYFRPSQDAVLQANMVISKLTAAGGLMPGDLPPVLDFESADGLASSVVIAQAKLWLATIEGVLKVKPIIYTAAFMSDVIGTSFGGYTLWVANYTPTCPTMPSGWTDWHFWQNSGSGTVAGVSGPVDTDFFNGTLPELQKLTIKDAGPAKGSEVGVTADVLDTRAKPSGDIPNDGSQGATIGSGTPTQETNGAPITPCR
jgi:lysozyme